jgi:HAD superfamily hydrolase (TIGR01450 family)
MSSQKRNLTNSEALKSKKLFIFDIEGVLCNDIDNPHVISHAPEFVNELRSRGKKIHVITNISRKTKRDILVSLNKLNFNLKLEDISTAGSTTASYINARLPQARCFLLSEGGIKEEFEARGLKIVDKEPVDVVVVASDRTLTYRRLNMAMRLVRGGAEFVCAGPSAVFRGTFGEDKGYFIGGGAITEAIRLASGVAPHYIGKPYPEIFQEALKRWGLEEGEAVMIGDKYSTDVEGAKALGIASVLVSEGGLKPGDFVKGYAPDLVVRDVAELHSVLT